ncbi:hypothetical protein [Bacillus suaedaesalsae]|uniref:DUF4181 domain-containing protein n=1 Tax=Bacillus suaedaesalsae TaxID=2810349 RepID=A0ABS2DK75_9BACI|nr:hypothetical protein [Bacillus suaedaesalsae]MBM6618907.1 hypothetical protein [Bacillus suaedaesalsae]
MNFLLFIIKLAIFLFLSLSIVHFLIKLIEKINGIEKVAEDDFPDKYKKAISIGHFIISLLFIFTQFHSGEIEDLVYEILIILLIYFGYQVIVERIFFRNPGELFYIVITFVLFMIIVIACQPLYPYFLY